MIEKEIEGEDLIVVTMKTIWEKILMENGFKEEETTVKITAVEEGNNFYFTPKVIERLQAAYEKFHCLGKGCKREIIFNEDAVTVKGENIAITTAQILYLMGGIKEES